MGLGNDSIVELLALLEYARTFSDFPSNLTVAAALTQGSSEPRIGNNVIASGVVMIVLAIAVVAARLWARLVRTKVSFGLDDWFIIVGAVSYYCAMISILMI